MSGLLSFLALALLAVLPALPPIAIWLGVRHGPFPNRWWQGETVAGFAATVGGLAFAAGFFGPMLLSPGSNQGPLLGIVFTGPIGLVVGVLWGLARAAGRRGA